jgi:putative peptide zinc metalloprotease protein
VHATRTLLAAPTVVRLAEIVRPLFRAALAVPALIAAAAAQAAFLRASHGLRLEDIPAEAYFAGALLFLVTLPLHELGHAGACSHFACRPGAMGFGLYLVFPCFYTDVSDAWRLPRWKRVVVDLGGMHVQFLCAGLFSLMFLGTGGAAWAAAVLMVDGSIVLNLKPYLRRDGYWILTDVVGIPAPYPAAREYARYLVAPRRRATARPALLLVSPRLRWFTLAYVALVGAASTFVMAAVLWKTATVILPAYPSVLAGLVREPLASVAWLRGFLRALVRTSVIGGVLLAWTWRQLGRARAEKSRTDSVVAGADAPGGK